MTTRTVTIQATKQQRKFLSSEADNVVIQGGARSGKTWVGVLKSLLLLDQHPGVTGMYVSPTYRQFDQSALPHLQTLADRLGLLQTWEWNKTKGIITLPNRSTMLLRSADDPGSLLGATLGWAVCDEVGLWRSKQAMDYLQDRLSDPNGPRQLYATFTPKGVHHWAFRLLGEPREGLEIIRARTTDNPTLPADYIDRLRREHGEGSMYWRQEVLGEYVAWEGLIFPQFSPDVHVAEPPAIGEMVNVVCGVDWGWTAPGVMLVVGFDKNGSIWLLDEICERQRGMDWWVEQGKRLRETFGVSRFACDPSQPANIDMMVRSGIPAERGHNAILPGIAAIAARLEAGTLRVSPRCVNLISELGMYCWRSRSDGSIREDEPEDANNHACDGLRYAIMALIQPSQTRRTIRFVDPVTI